MNHPQAPALPGPWRLNSLLFLASQFITGITSMVVQYAIVWYLTQKSGSATVLSRATLLAMLPMVVLSPFVGTFVDRWNKKALLIVPDVVAAAAAVVLSVVGTVNSTFPLWLVYVSLLVRAVAQTFQMPTIQSIVPTLVPPSHITQINGHLGMVQSATLIVSPALGAMLYGFVPINALILLDVLGAALGIVMLLFITIRSNAATLGERPHVVADAIFGLKRIGTARGLWPMIAISSLFALTLMPAASMYPLMTIAFFHGTVAQAGIVEMVWSVGSLAGGAIIGAYGKWNDRVRPVMVAMGVLGVSFGLCGVLPPTMRGFAMFVALNTLAGLATAFPGTLPTAMVQQSFPPQELGRVFGVQMSLMNLSGPVGLVIAGPVADRIGVQWMFVVAGVGALLCAALIAAVPSVRLFDQNLHARLAQDTVIHP
ncbi:MAG: MFS transporter [Bifidobacterium sp.]|jgi:DHA3 family macrolide efflux protein-like MFS transporter